MRSVVGGLVLVGMLALTGCVDGDRLPTLPPTPTSTPIFASEEEALAAAEAAYAAYNEVSALVTSEGGIAPERLAPFVTEAQLQDELETATLYREQGIHTEGRASLIRTELQQFSESGDVVDVVIYACLDIEAVRVIDASGTDVTPVDRAALVALEIAFEGREPGPLLLASSDLWSDSSFCSA